MATRLKLIFTQRRQPNALCVKSTVVPGALLTTIVSALLPGVLLRTIVSTRADNKT